MRQARLVLTVSDFASADLTRYLRIPSERIRVAVEAPAPAFQPVQDANRLEILTRRLGIPAGARWFIYVGGFNPHKHVEDIVRAHAAIRRAPADPPYLLLVGTIDADVFHGSQAMIRRAIDEAGTVNLVKWTGFVPDELTFSIPARWPSSWRRPAKGSGCRRLRPQHAGHRPSLRRRVPYPNYWPGEGSSLFPAITPG